jgi:parallel beta-helix repeat protein
VSSHGNFINNTHFSNADFALILINSTHNSISNNTISNGPAGLLWLLYSCHNRIINNTISNSLEGICLDQSSKHNLVLFNILKNNSHCNLMIESKSNNNIICNNNLLGDTRIQAYLLNCFQTYFRSNYWDDHQTRLPRIIRGEIILTILPNIRLPWFGIDWKPSTVQNEYIH